MAQDSSSDLGKSLTTQKHQMDKSHVIPKMIMKILATTKADSSEATLSDIVQ
jgi:hypothetical protein